MDWSPFVSLVFPGLTLASGLILAYISCLAQEATEAMRGLLIPLRLVQTFRPNRVGRFTNFSLILQWSRIYYCF